MNTLKIEKTVLPETTMDVNEWCELFKVGSRCEKYTREEIGSHLNDQYDFSKLSQNTDSLSFFESKYFLKLQDL
jgi:hypothetical protein